MRSRSFSLFAMLWSLLLMVVSCSSDDDLASLKIYNKTSSEYDFITAVYLSENDSENKTLVFSGSVAKGDFYYIDVEPGNYRVWCVVETQILGVSVAREIYSTGYKNNVELAGGDVVEIDFDGSGIYEL